MLLGVDHSSNTFMHEVEEWVNIPSRLRDTHEQLYSVLPSGEELLVPSRRHCSNDGSLYFPKIDRVLEENGAVHRGSFGDGETRVCDSESLTRIIFGMLVLNLQLFSNNSPLDIELYKCQNPLEAISGLDHLFFYLLLRYWDKKTIDKHKSLFHFR